MIEWIRIKNLALIEEAEIEFKPGFNVITGETGAGKTILIGAIGMLLGERADKSVIRTGVSSCEICCSIKAPDSLSKNLDLLFGNFGISASEDGNVFIKRTISQSSSRNFVNDSPVTLQTLKELGNILIDTHGPHEHQSLLKQSVQLDLLDRYGGLGPDISACSEIYLELKKVLERKERLEKELPSVAEAEHLRSIVEEIGNASPQPGEDEELSIRHNLAANAHDILESSGTAVKMLNESDNSISDRISEVYRIIQNFEKADSEIAAKFLKNCEFLKESVNELADNVQRWTSNIELDEKEFAGLEERLRILQALKRRYGPTLDDVMKTADEAGKKLNELENFDEIRNEIAGMEKSLSDELMKTCAGLSKLRKEISAKFAKKVCAELRKLGFSRSDFSVRFEEVEPGAGGSDRIDFIFSANPGEKEQPLREIASSGEISRVMLGLKTVLAEADSIPVLVFDEIDVNIGGETASVVGGELKKLGKMHQVLCISHLPQVAACSDTHFKVEKTVSKGRTFTAITELADKDRKGEIARMLGGGNAALAHAGELLK